MQAYNIWKIYKLFTKLLTSIAGAILATAIACKIGSDIIENKRKQRDSNNQGPDTTSSKSDEDAPAAKRPRQANT